MGYRDLKVDVYADSADIQVMINEYERGIVKGFTTNPTLMKKAGIKSYTNFAKELINKITDYPISFEVFADDFETMKKEARELASYGKNVYVKIPITNSIGKSSVELIRELSLEKINLNITAVFTLQQVKDVVSAFAPHTNNIVSVFAGRIADTGVDAEDIMKEAVKICKSRPNIKCLWASCREVFNIIQADRCGADIITVTEDIMKKIPLLGKDLEEYSLETVKMFEQDSRKLGFKII